MRPANVPHVARRTHVPAPGEALGRALEMLDACRPAPGVDAGGHRPATSPTGPCDLIERLHRGRRPRGDADGAARSPSPRQTASGVDLTVLTTGAKKSLTQQRRTVKSARTRQRRCRCTRNTEVEEQSVGGGRHDVRAYISVRQLIPRGPATWPGPFLIHPWRGCRLRRSQHLTPPQLLPMTRTGF